MAMSQQSALPPATAYHRAPVRLANGALRLLQRVGVGRADLSEEGLIAAARKATGLEEFGDESFRIPMRILLRDLEDEADMNPLGRYLARMSLLRLLKDRLWAEDLFDRHPEILEREIAPPVVVVGLARSGTTRLHRLLASDRRFLHLKAWETVNPVPWPECFGVDPDPRIENIGGALKAILYMSPQIATVHPLGAMEVEEEVGLIEHAFSSQIHEVVHYVPNFANWLMANDQTYAYEYMLKLLKLIEWFRGDEPGCTWVLKTPQHMQDLDALMRVMPGARLVCNH
ncbi:MAG: sulfotransferase, partial [Deltaproteobacteria bacterium]|nr:sulfotransferase [Deltaproteobacteria bacterium]